MRFRKGLSRVSQFEYEPTCNNTLSCVTSVSLSDTLKSGIMLAGSDG